MCEGALLVFPICFLACLCYSAVVLLNKRHLRHLILHCQHCRLCFPPPYMREYHLPSWSMRLDLWGNPSLQHMNPAITISKHHFWPRLCTLSAPCIHLGCTYGSPLWDAIATEVENVSICIKAHNLSSIRHATPTMAECMLVCAGLKCEYVRPHHRRCGAAASAQGRPSR